MDQDDYIWQGDDWLTGEPQILYVYLVATVGLLFLAALALRRWLRYRRAAKQADNALMAGDTLAPGETIVIGKVEWAAQADLAVRVEIEQEGVESEDSGVWTHEWTETRSTLHVHPFYLRHSSGRRIRVEPGDDVTLVEVMSGVIRVNLSKRIRVAELMPDKKVFAVGELRRAPDPEAPVEGGYRNSTNEGYVIVPPRGRSMLLSREPPAERFRRKAALHLRLAIMAAVAALAFNLGFSPTLARWLRRTGEARVTHLEASGDRAEPDTFFRSRDYFVAPILGIIVIIFIFARREKLAWYEQKKLVEKGRGRLAESKPTVPEGQERS